MEMKNEKDFYIWLGNEFKMLRERKGLLQKEVAEKAGITPGELSKFERYGVKLSVFRVALLLKAVGISFEELLSRTEDADVKKNSLSLSMATS